LFVVIQENYRLNRQNSLVEVFRGGATRGGTGGNSPPTPHKGQFCKSSKTDEKILEVWGGDVTNHTWISTWVCHKWFSKPDLTYILSPS